MTSGVITELPRRESLEAPGADSALLQMRSVSFKARRIDTIRGFFKWLSLILAFGLATFQDWLLGRDSTERRAKRLRAAFQRRGGSFVKLGILLSTRIDFIPWVFGNELSSMPDRMEPFPISDAVAIIERETKKPLAATFSQLDPDPILSTSLACFYQALLLSTEKVIVKVRRPGIGEQIMADLQAFDWLMSIIEFLTIFRPGRTRAIRSEYRELLLEELDFLNEARRQAAFRQAAIDSRKNFFSAPFVYLGLSGEEVMVSEFKSGMWLWELLSALENNDETILDQARAMNIDPHKLAKRLLWVNYWSWGENLFFHADPNPDNIIIGPNNKLYFINFAIADSLNRSKRQAMRQVLSYAWKRDPQNMARSALVLMEPLPPIDVLELTQELESYNWQLIYALEANPKSLKWQERTSVMLWLGIIRLARKYSITIETQVLRLIRTTLIFESLAAQLDVKIDFVERFQKFSQYRAEQARRQFIDNFRNQLEGKQDGKLVIRLDRIAQTVSDILNRGRHWAMLPSINFNTLISKWALAVYVFFRFLAYLFGFTLLVLGVSAIIGLIQNQPFDARAALQAIIFSPLYLIMVIFLIIINGRTVLFRMDDREI